jgi:hypothetical protein
MRWIPEELIIFPQTETSFKFFINLKGGGELDNFIYFQNKILII